MIEVKRITIKDPLYQSERDLRNKILLRPIGLTDYAWEMNDHKAWHFVAVEKNKLLGCVILVPLDDENKQCQLMQMAVDTNLQGKGIGKLLINGLLDFAKGVGIEEVICHSRQYANDFYRKMGFSIYGETFEEAGILHNHMRILII